MSSRHDLRRRHRSWATGRPERVNFAPSAVIAMAFAALSAAPAAGFESDPFLALEIEIEIADSAGVINEYLNAEIETVLDRINSRAALKRCEELPPRIYRHLFAHLLSSRFKHFLEHSPKIQRFPADDVGYWQYLRGSIYRRPIFPYTSVASGSASTSSGTCWERVAVTTRSTCGPCDVASRRTKPCVESFSSGCDGRGSSSAGSQTAFSPLPIWKRITKASEWRVRCAGDPIRTYGCVPASGDSIGRFASRTT
jgi:hypothetical protein